VLGGKERGGGGLEKKGMHHGLMKAKELFFRRRGGMIWCQGTQGESGNGLGTQRKKGDEGGNRDWSWTCVSVP